jgi:hypothetical protein
VLVGMFIAGAAAASTTACLDARAALTQKVEARRLASELHVQFTKAADAANRAVMADADDASIAAAREAEQATEAVAREVIELQPILEWLGYSDERRVLDTFNARFAEYRKLDAEVLPLAVENTNLKAQRLSFGRAREAADSFRTSLESAANLSASTNAWRAEALAARAGGAVLEIQVLQAPHIAESDDDAMTRLEKQMAASEAAARKWLEQVRPLVPPGGGSHLAAASTALDQFMAINREIVTLSRRNSNVRSLALSLGRKRTLTAQCEEQLRALQAGLERHEIAATR